jgi:hypothetical protein
MVIMTVKNLTGLLKGTRTKKPERPIQGIARCMMKVKKPINISYFMINIDKLETLQKKTSNKIKQDLLKLHSDSKQIFKFLSFASDI